MMTVWILLMACRTTDVDSGVEIQVRPDDEPSVAVEPEEETELRDIDQDGFTEDVDCDDWNPNVYPGATEILNNIDDDCDGYIDGDGVFSGDLSMTATAIYQGQAYHFAQMCTGSIERDVGQVDMLVLCEIDQTQERAGQLLGGILTIEAHEVFIFEQSGGGNAMFQSVEGEVEWDAQGSVGWQWSNWEQNQSQTVGTNIQLDALHLDITLSGELQKE